MPYARYTAQFIEHIATVVEAHFVYHCQFVSKGQHRQLYRMVEFPAPMKSVERPSVTDPHLRPDWVGFLVQGFHSFSIMVLPESSHSPVAATGPGAAAGDRPVCGGVESGPMKARRAVILSLVLVVVGGLLIAYAVFPRTISANDHMTIDIIDVVLSIGIASLFSSVWLSGYAFATDKRRALLAPASLLISVIAIKVGTHVYYQAHQTELVRLLQSQGVKITTNKSGMIGCAGGSPSPCNTILGMDAEGLRLTTDKHGNLVCKRSSDQRCNETLHAFQQGRAAFAVLPPMGSK